MEFLFTLIALFAVVIDGYTHNRTLTSGDSVPLGTQLILVCWVVGLPYGTPLSYTWTCPNGPCEVEGYYGRKIYKEHTLAVNVTSTRDGGTYTCQVTATGGQNTGTFEFGIQNLTHGADTGTSVDSECNAMSCGHRMYIHTYNHLHA